jgi:hypothetical protein
MNKESKEGRATYVGGTYFWSSVWLDMRKLVNWFTDYEDLYFIDFIVECLSLFKSSSTAILRQFRR